MMQFNPLLLYIMRVCVLCSLDPLLRQRGWKTWSQFSREHSGVEENAISFPVVSFSGRVLRPEAQCCSPEPCGESAGDRSVHVAAPAVPNTSAQGERSPHRCGPSRLCCHSGSKGFSWCQKEQISSHCSVPTMAWAPNVSVS